MAFCASANVFPVPKFTTKHYWFAAARQLTQAKLPPNVFLLCS